MNPEVVARVFNKVVSKANKTQKREVMTTTKLIRNQAYRSILEKLPDCRKKVWFAFCELKKATSQEVAAHLGIPINQVTGRIKEMVELGNLKTCGTKINSKTGKKNTLYCVSVDNSLFEVKK